MKTPSVSQDFCASGPLAPVPSPKSQFHEVGSPAELSLRSTTSPAFNVSDENVKLACSSSSSIISSTTCCSSSTINGALESSPSNGKSSVSSCSRPSAVSTLFPPSPRSIPSLPKPKSPRSPKTISSLPALPAAASIPSASPCSDPPTASVLIFEITLISSPRNTAASEPSGSLAQTVPSNTSSSNGRPATPKRTSSTVACSSRSTIMMRPSA